MPSLEHDPAARDDASAVAVSTPSSTSRTRRAIGLRSLLQSLRALRPSVRGFALASWMGLAALLVLWAIYGTDAGVTWDEVLQREYGNRVLAWFRSGFRDESAMYYRDLYLYGGLFDMVAQWVVAHSWAGPYETRHMMSGLVAIAGIVGSWKLASMVGGARAGFLAALLLSFTPMWIGHGLFNPKDIPFGAAAVFASVAAVRIALVPRLRTRDFVLAGLAVGLGLAARPGGMFLFAYPCMAVAGRALLELAQRRSSGTLRGSGRYFSSMALQLGLGLAAAWAVMLCAWPWAQLSPFERPLEAMHAASHFEWGGSVLFRGRHIEARMLPRSYLLVWFGLTLPETYLYALVTSLGALALWVWRGTYRAQVALAVAVITASVLLPLAAALVLRPVVYDAQRHFLFLVPPAAALSGIALSYLLGSSALPRWLRGAIAAAGVALLLLVGNDMLALHPYEYVYFNRLSGGLAKNYKRYETDYWGASYKEGLRWVVDELLADVRPGHPLRVTGCDNIANRRLAYYVERWPEAKNRIKVVGSYSKADILLAIQRFDCFRNPGPILYTVSRQNAPLLRVKRTVKP